MEKLRKLMPWKKKGQEGDLNRMEEGFRSSLGEPLEVNKATWGKKCPYSSNKNVLPQTHSNRYAT